MHRPCDFKCLSIARKLRIAITSSPLVGSSSTKLAGSMHQRASQRHLDPLPLRQALGAAIDETLHVEAGDQIRGARPKLPAADSLERTEVVDVLARGQIAVQPGRMRQHAEMRARARGLAANVDAVDTYAAAVGGEHPINHAQGGRFAGAVRSQKPGDFPVARGEGDLAHGLDGAESLAQSLGLDHGAGPVESTKNGAG